MPKSPRFHHTGSALIVEDDLDVAAVLRNSLHLWMANLEVTHVSSYVDAAQSVTQRTYSVIVSDFNLGPGKNGLDVWRLTSVPFLLISGQDIEEIVRNDGTRLPPFLQKPFTPIQFAQAVADLIDSKSAAPNRDAG